MPGVIGGVPIEGSYDTQYLCNENWVIAIAISRFPTTKSTSTGISAPRQHLCVPMNCRAVIRTLLFLSACCSSLAISLVSCTSATSVGTTTATATSVPQAPLSHPWIVPPGVIVAAGDRGKSFVEGLYPSSLSSDPFCCWLAPNAHVQFANPTAAKTLVAWIYVNPDIPKYKRAPPFVQLDIAGRTVARRTALILGVNAVPFSVPADATNNAPKHLTIRSDGFIPQIELHNGDTRALGVILLAINTGQRPDHTGQPWVIPAGVYISDSARGKTFVDGLYPSDLAGDPSCCWLAPDARIRFLAPKGSSRVALTIYVNGDIPAYQAKPPWLQVIAAAGAVLNRVDRLAIGENRIVVTLPLSMRDGKGPYMLMIRSAGFVPNQELHNGDTRKLGVILKGIAPL